MAPVFMVVSPITKPAPNRKRAIQDAGYALRHLDGRRQHAQTDARPWRTPLQAEEFIRCFLLHVSVISGATESDASRFVHIERSWAAQRHVDGFVYYIPIVIDDTEKPKLEPASFAKIHFDRLPNGIVTPAFANKLQKWVEEYRDSGQPRA
jgi:hypothetical protein